LRILRQGIYPCILILFVFLLFGCSHDQITDPPFEIPDGEIELIFSAAADMRNFTGSNPDHFRGVCERIASGGPGSFMVSPGDLDPPAGVYSDLKTYVGSGYLWYPAVGNHEAETLEDMQWLRSFNAGGNTLKNVVNTGPPGSEETTYSFEYGNVHFVILNEYFDGASDTGTDGDIVLALRNWLNSDLSANSKPVVFVIGHEPAYPLPDEENGRLRHETDSLNKYAVQRDAFWALLEAHGVKAYICGHTHNYSAAKFGSVWQIDVGHARGTADSGARSTFVMFYIMADGSVWLYAYRLDLNERRYMLAQRTLID
jgi:hypothetical protein